MVHSRMVSVYAALVGVSMLIGIMLSVTTVILAVHAIEAVNQTHAIIATDHAESLQRDAIEKALVIQVVDKLDQVSAELAKLQGER